MAIERPALSLVRSPLGGDGGAGFRRGLLIHRLLQSLPQLEPARRAEAGRRFLARPVHGLDAAAQAEMLAETLAVLDDPDAASLFGPNALAEVPVVGARRRARHFGPHRPAGGAIPTDVTIVDYKTLRPVPEERGGDPADLSRTARRLPHAAVAVVYPGRAVRCGVLWTDGPTPDGVSERRLAPIDARPRVPRFDRRFQENSMSTTKVTDPSFEASVLKAAGAGAGRFLGRVVRAVQDDRALPRGHRDRAWPARSRSPRSTSTRTRRRR